MRVLESLGITKVNTRVSRNLNIYKIGYDYIELKYL